MTQASYPQPPSTSPWKAFSVAVLFLCFVLRFIDSADAAAFYSSAVLRRNSHKATATTAAPSLLWSASTDSGNNLVGSNNSDGTGTAAINGAAAVPISMLKATQKRRLLHFNPKKAMKKIKKSGHSDDKTKNIGRTLVLGTIGGAGATLASSDTARSKLEETKEGAGATYGDEATADEEDRDIATFKIGCHRVEHDAVSVSASPEGTAANHQARARTSTALFASSSGRHDKSAQRVAKPPSTRRPQKARSVLKKIHGRLRPTSSFVPDRLAKHEEKTLGEKGIIILDGEKPATIEERPNSAAHKNPSTSAACRQKSDESDLDDCEAASDLSNTTTESNVKVRVSKLSSGSDDESSSDDTRGDNKEDEKKASGFSFFAKTQEEKITVSKAPVQKSSKLKTFGKSTSKAKKVAVSVPSPETKEDLMMMMMMMPVNATKSSTVHNPNGKKTIKSGTTNATTTKMSLSTLKVNARKERKLRDAKAKATTHKEKKIETVSDAKIENANAQPTRELGTLDSLEQPNSDITTPSPSKSTAFSIEAENTVIMESKPVVAVVGSSETLSITESITTPKATPNSTSVRSENINSPMHDIQHEHADDGAENVSTKNSVVFSAETSRLANDKPIPDPGGNDADVVFELEVSTSMSNHETTHVAPRIGTKRARRESKGEKANVGRDKVRLKESVEAVTVEDSKGEAKSTDAATRGISPLLSLADSLASIDLVRAEKEKIRAKPPVRISPSPRSRVDPRSMPRLKSEPQSQVYRGARRGADEVTSIPNADKRVNQTQRRSSAQTPNISTGRPTRGRPKPTRSPPPAPVVTTDRSTRKGAQSKRDTSRDSHDTSSTLRTRTGASNPAEEAKFSAMRNQFMSTGTNSENPGSSGRQVSVKRISIEPYETTEAPSDLSTETYDRSIGESGIGSEISPPATTTFSSDPYQPAFDVGTNGPQVVSSRTVNTQPYGMANVQEGVEYTPRTHPADHVTGQVGSESYHSSFDIGKGADQQASHPNGDTAVPPPQDREPPRPKSPAEEARAALMRRLVGDPEVEASEGYKPAFDMGSSGSQKVSTRQVSSAPYSPSGNKEPVVVFDKTRKKKKYRPADPSSQPSISLISSGGDTQTVQSTRQVSSAPHQRSDSSISQQISTSQVSAPPREPLEGGGTIMISGDKAQPVRKSKKKIPASFASGAGSRQEPAESYQRSFDIDSSGPQQVSTRTVSTTPYEGKETVVDYRSPPDPAMQAFEASRATKEPYLPSFDIGSSGRQMVSERRVNPQPYGMPSVPNTDHEASNSNISPQAINASPASGSPGSYLPDDAQDGEKFDYSSPQQAAYDASSVPYEPALYTEARGTTQASTGQASSDIYQSHTLVHESFLGLDAMAGFSESQPYQTREGNGSPIVSSPSIGQNEAKEYVDAQQQYQLHDELPRDSRNATQPSFDTSREAYNIANEIAGQYRTLVDRKEQYSTSSHMYEESTQQLRQTSFSENQFVSQQRLHDSVEGGSTQEVLRGENAAVTPETDEFLARQVETESNQVSTVGDNTTMVFCQFSTPEPRTHIGHKTAEEISASAQATHNDIVQGGTSTSKLPLCEASSEPRTQAYASSDISPAKNATSFADLFTPTKENSEAAAPAPKQAFENQPAIGSDENVASFLGTVPITQFDKQEPSISAASLSNLTETKISGFAPNAHVHNHEPPFASTSSPPLPGPAHFGTDPGFVPYSSGISTISASPVVQGAMPGTVVPNGATGSEEATFSEAILSPVHMHSVLPSSEHTESQESGFPLAGTSVGTPAFSASPSAQNDAPWRSIAFVANIKNRWMGGTDSPAATTLASSPERSDMEDSSKPKEMPIAFSSNEQPIWQRPPPQPIDLPVNSFSSAASHFSQTTVSVTEGKNTFPSPTLSVSETSSGAVSTPAAIGGSSADASLHPAYLAAIAASLQVTAADDTADSMVGNATSPSAPSETTFGMRKGGATKAYLDNLGSSTSLFACRGSVLDESITSGSLEYEPSYLSPDAQNEHSSADQSENQPVQSSLNTPGARGYDINSSFIGATPSDWGGLGLDHAAKRDSSLDSTTLSVREAVIGIPWHHGPAFKGK